MIAEADLTYEQMRDLEKTHRCGICGGSLTTAWGGAFGVKSYVLRCVKNISHTGITRHNRTEESYKNIIKKEFKLDSNSLMVMPESKMLQRIDMAKFPQELTPPEKKLLAQVAITYGFDPLMGEVTVYQSRPYVSIDGRYRKAQETGKLDGVNTRPATKQEREEWKIPEGDFFFCAEVFVKGAEHPFYGWGRVHQSETVGGKGFKPVEKNPQRMAEKRAEAQALRKAFHIPLPSVEDIGSPEDEPARPEVKTIVAEVIDVPGNGHPIVISEENHLPTDPTTIKTMGDFYQAVCHDFPVYKKIADILKDLGVSRQEDLTESPELLYLKIAELRLQPVPKK